jgi:hypothetical protein
MRVSELAETLRGCSPDAEVVVCLKVPDGLGDYLLFSESEASSAEPYPGDDGRLLVHSTMPLGELSSQTCAPMLRELARALENEADSMEREELGCDTWDDSQQ